MLTNLLVAIKTSHSFFGFTQISSIGRNLLDTRSNTKRKPLPIGTETVVHHIMGDYLPLLPTLIGNTSYS